MRLIQAISFLLLSAFCAHGQAIITYSKPLASSDSRISRPVPVIDQKKDNNISVLLSDGRVIYSDDRGDSWKMHDPKSSQQPDHFRVFTSTKGDLFLVSGTMDGKLSVGMSADHGVSWKELGEVQLRDIKGAPHIYFDQDEQHLLVSYLSGGDCGNQLHFIQTSNGKKWSDPVKLNHDELPCNAVASAAELAVGPYEYIYAIWHQEGKILLDRSFDQGERWLRSDITVRDVEKDKLAGGPLIAADYSKSVLSGALYAMWTEKSDSGDQLICIRSTNNGDFWNTPIVVNSEGSGSIHAPNVRIDRSNGFLYVLYYTGNGAGAYDLHLAYSDNGGQSFPFNMKINNDPIPASEDALEGMAAFDVFAGKIIVSWMEVRDGEEHVMLKYLSYEDI